MLLGLVILLTSFNSITFKDKLKDFHIKAAGAQSVFVFENKFPQIVKDEKIYLAYLQVFCQDNKQDYFELFNKNIK